MAYVRPPLTQPNLLKYVIGLRYFQLAEIVVQIINSVTNSGDYFSLSMGFLLPTLNSRFIFFTLSDTIVNTILLTLSLCALMNNADKSL